jgi:hypothetical protein
LRRFVPAEREHFVSHFCVLVIGENVEQQLAPYQENNMGDCPKEYLAFVEAEDCKVDPETGKRGYWENPNKKWDWYRIGGRYAGRLKVNDGVAAIAPERLWDGLEIAPGFVDQARAGDIDWGGMRQKRLADRANWWAEYEAKVRTGRDRKFAAYEYGVQEGDTRETYISRGEEFSCFAVVKDGRWYEKGEMGWWATVSNEKEAAAWQEELKALLSGLPPDTLLTVVDCHI